MKMFSILPRTPVVRGPQFGNGCSKTIPAPAHLHLNTLCTHRPYIQRRQSGLKSGGRVK